MSLIEKHWPQVIQLLGQQNHGLVTLLKRGSVKSATDNLITIEMSYAFHKDQLEQSRYLTVVEDVMAQVFGGQVRLQVTVGSKASTRTNSPMANITPQIDAADQALVTAVEEAFAV